jgi:hypothetical protein
VRNVDPGEWAREEFGHARLGHALRVRALVRTATGCARRPGGKVTSVFKRGADRESAYRLVENESVDAKAVMTAAHEAAARRCAGARFVYVPIDKTSLNITDLAENKGFGMIGTSSAGATGLNVVTALAITPDGVPQGIAHQRYWARPRKARSSRRQRKKTPLGQRESRLWQSAMEDVASTFAVAGNGSSPWFQIDREGDVSGALEWAVDAGHLLTVRAQRNRRLAIDGKPRTYVRDFLEALPALGVRRVHKSARPGQSERIADVEVRATTVELDIPVDEFQKRRRVLPINVVLVSEPSPPPGEEALDWLLFTTAPVDALEDAVAVVVGYSQRWRIEEFHRAWKSGTCNVEDSQTRSPTHLIRWAVLLASVAVRAIRLAYLARAQSTAPASLEFSDDEIVAIKMVVKPRDPPVNPTLGLVVGWLASIGGYTGPKSAGGPPGFLVLSRGLEYIQPMVAALVGVRALKRDQW